MNCINKGIISLFFLIGMCSLVYAVDFSDNIYDYYNFGSGKYGYDGLNATDVGPDGTVAVLDNSISTTGWENPYAGSVFYSDIIGYGNSPLSITDGQSEGAFNSPLLNNGSFTGIIRMSLYCNSTNGLAIRIIEPRTGSYLYRMTLAGDIDAEGYESDNSTWFDETIGQIPISDWFNLSIEFNGTGPSGMGDVKYCINDTPQRIITNGYGAMQKIQFAFEVASGCKIDNFMITKNGLVLADEGGGEPDTTPPTSSNFQNNASTVSKYGDVVNWSIDLADETGLSGYIFAHNQTGTLTNGSFTEISGSPATASEDESSTITMAKDNYICGQYWFNDTSGNVNQTDFSCFTIANSVPTQPVVSYPSDSTVYSIINYLNYTGTDGDGDSLTYDIYINGTINISGIGTNVSSWNASDGYYNMTVTATDGTDTSSHSSVIAFRLDSTVPLISWNLPSGNIGGSFSNYTFDVDVVDTYLDCVGLYINWTGNSTEAFRNVTCGVSSPYKVVDNFNFSQYGEGNFSVEICANDTATASPPIPNYNASIDNDKKEMSFIDTEFKDQTTMKMEIIGQDFNAKDVGLSLYSKHDGEHLEYGAYIDEMNEGDKVKTTYYPGNLGFTMRNTDLPCHFTYGNKYHHHKDLIEDGWTIDSCELKKDGTIEVISHNEDYSKASKDKNGKIIYDPMSGQINSKCEVRYMYRDVTDPVIANLSLSSYTIDLGSTVTIYADAGDDHSVAGVYVNVTSPSSDIQRFSMNKGTGSQYSKLYAPSTAGTYSFGFDVTDNAGNVASNQSTGFSLVVSTSSGSSPSASTSSSYGTTYIISDGGDCNIQKVKPSTGKIWLMKDTSVEIVLKNTDTTIDTFSFTLIGDTDCEIQHNSASLNGESTFTNSLKCTVGEDRKEGTLIVESSQCDTSFSIVTDNSFIGGLLSRVDKNVAVVGGVFLFVVIILTIFILFGAFSS